MPKTVLRKAALDAPYLKALLMVICTTLPLSCGVYSFTGASTNAKTISITEFYNNTDLGPANLGQTFTNSLKTYFIQNTSLTVVAENGELQFDGEVSDFKVTQIAPTSNGGDPAQATYSATSSRLTISVKVTYVNSLDDKMSFKERSFSFYKDFTNDQNLSDIQEQYITAIFDRIINDIFNASVANW